LNSGFALQASITGQPNKALEPPGRLRSVSGRGRAATTYMLRLNTKLWSHTSHTSGDRYFSKEILTNRAMTVRSYPNLVRRVAELSYYNPEHILFFRGQPRCYYKLSSVGRVPSFYPSIYRSPGRSLSDTELSERFTRLDRYCEHLLSQFKAAGISGHEKLAKFPELVWAILQHYEVCLTPLLDVTHSLRVAASFALTEKTKSGYVFVFGFPHPNGSITYSVEQELMNIRLLSICPPDAQRPYFQEGFVVGSFPSRRVHKHPNLDVGVRLIAQYQLGGSDFWQRSFPPIPRNALFPKRDKITALCKKLGEV
jgi:hypothetical protein